MHEISFSLPWLLLILCLCSIGSSACMWCLSNRQRKRLQGVLDQKTAWGQETHEKFLLAQEKLHGLSTVAQKLQLAEKAINEKQNHITHLELSLKQERQATGEKIALLENAQNAFQQAFKALSAEALSKNNQDFMALAKTTLGKFHESARSDFKSTEQAFAALVTPVKEALGTVNRRMEEVEKNRIGAYEGLKEQVGSLLNTQKELRSETANLVKALRAPTVRGRWGEMQLRRVVEMSGMSAHCDFTEQVTLDSETGKLRPDMVVNLPNQKQIIIDAKTPLAAYLEALETACESQRRTHLKDHARQVRNHVNMLSSRAYWDQLGGKDGTTPEFVVLFLPGETIFTAALEQDPTLIEDGVQKNVILATPATLIALLHAVAFGWRQESLAENAREISELGRELYKRCSDMGSHMAKLGRDLNAAVGSYNKTVGSLERRILPSARKFKELRAATRESIPPLQSIEQLPRPLEAPELAPEEEEAAVS